MYIRKVLFTSKLAFVLVLLFMVVRTVLLPERIEKSLSPARAFGGDIASVGEAINPPALSLADYAEIVRRNPFGASDRITGSGKFPSTTDFAGDGSEVSEKLGLALLGTVSGDPAIARAVIKDLKTGTLNLYRVGQTVADACIESISPETVILTHNGEKKILRLYTAQSGGNDYPALAPSPQIINEKSFTVKTDLPAEETDTDVQLKPGSVETILKKATIEPYTVNGQMEGLRITGLEDLGAAKDLGLKNGDVIRVVNGQRLTSRQKAFQILKKLRSQAAVSIELLRDNEVKELSFATE